MQGCALGAASPLTRVLGSSPGRVGNFNMGGFILTYESGSDAALIRMVADLG